MSSAYHAVTNTGICLCIILVCIRMVVEIPEKELYRFEKHKTKCDQNA